ncbi:MFS general substrate transporter [Sanghuangporus baumii]|uniref:MFS general substrate transporter n=1 Tax=Sanghuangporus baumii TaxID=108892 RepID=A0A9Q5NDQ3_SANBA|nr:MFS general substrate transporter [Sanghuangporus baumii]
MASIHQRKLTGLEHRRHSKEKMDSNMPLDEKTPTIEFASDEASIDARDGDEALELVGVRRKTQFSEEYNLKLRKKLARILFRPFP